MNKIKYIFIAALIGCLIYVGYRFFITPRSDIDLAIHHLEIARRIDPSDKNVYLLLGRAYERLGDERALERNWEIAVRDNPDALWALIGRANVLISQGRIDEALAQTEIRLLEQPNDPDVWEVHGSILIGTNDQAATYAAMDKAFELDPSSNRYRNILDNFEDWGTPEQYRSFVTRNLGGNPDRAFTYYKFGQILISEADYATAAQEIGWAVELDPNTPLYSLERARAYIVWAENDAANAVEHLNAAQAELDKAFALPLKNDDPEYARELQIALQLQLDALQN